MNFKLKSKGFINETLVVEVTPNLSSPEMVTITCTSNQGYLRDWWDDTYVMPLLKSFAHNQNVTAYSQGEYFYSHGNLHEEAETDCEYSWSYTVDNSEVSTKLKEITEAFYSFHKNQNETANLTIQTIKSLRIEEIVGEQSWEVVKTSSRRGSRKV